MLGGEPSWKDSQKSGPALQAWVCLPTRSPRAVALDVGHQHFGGGGLRGTSYSERYGSLQPLYTTTPQPSIRRSTLNTTSHGPLRVTRRQSVPPLGCSLVGAERPAQARPALGASDGETYPRQASPEPSRSPSIKTEINMLCCGQRQSRSDGTRRPGATAAGRTARAPPDGP